MMSTRVPILAALILVYAASEASTGQLTSMAGVEAMEHVFTRSDRAHSESMAAIMKGMSHKKAWQVLDKNNLSSPALVEMTSRLHEKQSHLRRNKTGYSGIDGARKLLNDMIYESMSKYDAEIIRCTGFYAKQCAAMEACRGQIAGSNYLAAKSRELMLDAQGTINQAEEDIPTAQDLLRRHNIKCKDELEKMRTRLGIVEGDIKVLTNILNMTDCNKPQQSLLQKERLAVLRCQDPCTKKSFITFNHDYLKEKVKELRSSVSHGLMQDTFKDLFEGIESLESLDFLQLDSNVKPIIKKTKFNNPPVPRTEVPMNPCSDPDAGAPSAADKGKAKCSITGSQSCYKLQERFLLIQSGVKDERDNLMEEIQRMETMCEDIRNTLKTRIKNDQGMLEESATKLASATEKEAQSGESARQTARENDQLDKDLTTQMKTCSSNYINFETELCALKKIRGELYKMKGGGKDHSAFFQDCEVSKWDPEECSKECHGGEQKLARNILTHANGGAKCLPLTAMRKCNLRPCPVDCKLSTWAGWSKCSAECGSGVQQRLREVEVPMKYNGKPCEVTSQVKSCNNQACEQDCALSHWTKWSGCSKDCDGGTQKRQKYVKKAPRGMGNCPDRWSSDRLQYKKCNMFSCKQELAGKAMPCNKKLDVVLLLDGSGSLGPNGWKAEIKAAQTFVDALSGTGSQAQIAVILYSGPRTWRNVWRCIGSRRKHVDLSKVCKISSVTHFTNKMAEVKKKITNLKWPRGSTLTSIALLRAKAELSLGRADAKSVVVVITDGRPLSYRATGIASRIVRKATRLVWVPVTRYAPLKRIKWWATRRWQENVVLARTFKELEKPDLVTHVVANICPKTSPTVRFGRTTYR